MPDELMSGGAALSGTPSVTHAAPSPAPADVVETPASEPSVVSVEAQAASTDADADDLDTDDEDYTTLPQDPQVQKLLKRLRKQDRWVKKHRPLVQRTRDLNVDDLIVTQRNHAALMDRLQADPELLQRIVTPAAETTAQRQAPPRPQYQPLALPDPPFEASDEGGKYIHDLHKLVQTMHRELYETRHGFGSAFQDVLQWRKGLEGERQRSQVQQTVGKWTAAIDQFGQEYDEDGKELVSTEIKQFYQWAKANNRQDILSDPSTYIPKVLAQRKALARFKATSPSAVPAAIVQAASSQRIAEANRTRPGAAAFAGGVPTPARQKSAERVKDIIARKLGRHVPA